MKKINYMNFQHSQKIYIYICPVCNEFVILRKGKIRSHHFSHNKNSKCSFYEKPHVYESQLHKNAKERLKDILNSRGVVIIKHTCNKSNHIEKTRIKYTEKSEAFVEYTFCHNDTQKRADVALVDSSTNEIQYMFEIYVTHKQTDRPGVWFEIDAHYLNTMNDNDNDIYKFDCIRDDKICAMCSLEKANRKCSECKSNVYNKQNTDYYKCFKCFTKNKVKCIKCNKFVDKKYSLCYSCNIKDRY